MSNKKVANKKFEIKTIAAEAQQHAGVVAHDVAEVAKKAANAAGKNAKIVADGTIDLAKKAGRFLDTKSRELLAKEFEKSRPIAVASVARLRQANSGAKPAEIVELLSAEFMKNEKDVSAESEKFLTASTHFVITLNEIYGDKVRDNTQRQVLLYIVLAANSKAAKVIAQVGVVALTFASKRFAGVTLVVEKVKDLVTKSQGKMAWVSALATLAGVNYVGRKSASWVVVNASLKILGPAPASWPAAAKKPVAKKPAAARKPAAKKPAARKPKPSA
jgi:hypothetical protein